MIEPFTATTRVQVDTRSSRRRATLSNIMARPNWNTPRATSVTLGGLELVTVDPANPTIDTG